VEWTLVAQRVLSRLAQFQRLRDGS